MMNSRGYLLGVSSLLVWFFVSQSEAFTSSSSPSFIVRKTASQLYTAVVMEEDEKDSSKKTTTTQSTTPYSDQDSEVSKTTTSSVLKSQGEKFSKQKKSTETTAVEDDKTVATSSSSSSSSKHQQKHFDLPWNDIQKWALTDQLAKYTVQIPQDGDMKVITLWRTLSNEVVELSGYPVPFLVERQMELQQQQETRTKTSRTILPYLDDYEFTTAGGLSGAVYGVAGVADGTRIETTPVGDVQVTLPKGFVQTGSVLYELGRPRETSDIFSVPSSSSSSAGNVRSLAQSVATGAQQSARDASQQLLAQTATPENSIMGLDPDLVNLGALTGLVVVGATAVQALSHHLTVNVFWV